MELRLIEPRQMVVTQANELATSAYSMTLLEKRLMLLVASAMRQGDEYLKRYSFPAADVMHFLGLQNNKDGYHRLQELTGSLLSRVVTVKTHEGKGYRQFQWMAGAEYIPATASPTGQAQLELQVHSQMRPFLLELKERFSSVPFGEIAQLPSFHSMRIFEILWAQSHQLKREHVRYELAELKRILKVEKAYPNFFDFKRRVLDKAQRDLAEKTPLSFTYDVETQGRKVMVVVFAVTANKRAVQLGLNLPHRLSVMELPPLAEVQQSTAGDADKTAARLVGLGIREAKAREFVGVYGAAYVEQNLDVVEARQKQGQVKNLVAYIHKALAQDYRKQASPEEQAAREERDAKARAKQARESQEAQYERERLEMVASVQREIPADVIWEEFRPHMEQLAAANSVIAKSWRANSDKAESIEAEPLLRSFFHQFVLDTFAQPNFRSFEAWHKATNGNVILK